ncbi:hypothetical protein BGCPKDLD_5251 [Methylorubrum suomiense]|uniref:Uncharacterized protein n=1 Tax=Methylorubrum suomiense TaxID=144191 RepID=A0ABQ4V2D5_9HYPH|nr:hypothetical protein BGCPKDLD_5251 [Methylorubrum suomiense]
MAGDQPIDSAGQGDPVEGAGEAQGSTDGIGRARGIEPPQEVQAALKVGGRRRLGRVDARYRQIVEVDACLPEASEQCAPFLRSSGGKALGEETQAVG